MYISVPVKGSKKIMGSIDWISASADRVLILAEDVEFEPGELPANVEITYAAKNLQEARTMGLEWAEANGQDYSFQIDDDIRLQPEQAYEGFPTLKRFLDSYPFLGSVCAMPRLLHHYAAGRFSNKEYFLTAFPMQMWGIRISAYRETKGFSLKTMEDLYIGMAMWSNGYGSATIPNLVHDHIRRRLSESRKGGQPPSVRDKLIPEAVEVLKQEFAGNVLKSMNLGRTNKGFFKSSPRYNWEEMGNRLKNRFGSIEYKDHRMEI